MKTILELIQKHPVKFLILFASAIFVPLLGSYPVLGQWEPHYGRVAMEMAANGSWDWFLDPVYLGKHNFWSKPILCFWMVLPFLKILGPTELALRLPFALMGIGGVLLMFYVSKKLFNDIGRAVLTSSILALTPMYYLISKQFMWDIPLVVFLFGAISFLYLGERDDDIKLLRWAYVFLGLVMLTKGLLAIVLPGAIFFAWMLIDTDYERFRTEGLMGIFSQYFNFLKRLRVFEGFGIFLVVSAPWYIYMALKHGMPFYAEFFGKHHFGRMEGAIKKPDGPFEYYTWQVAIGTFPWIGFFVPGLILIGKEGEKKREWGFVLLSFFVIFLFFTLSGTKFPHYVFPAVPFFTMIAALPIFRFFRGEREGFFSIGVVLAALVIGVIAKDLGTGMNYRELLYIITTHRFQNWFGRVSDMLPYLRILVPPMVLFLLLPLLPFKKKLLAKVSMTGFVGMGLLFTLYINFIFVPEVLWVFSPKKLVEKYQEMKKPGDIIVDFHNWKNRSMYFYLGLDENLHRTKQISTIKSLVKNNPEANVFITTKKDKVPVLRAKLMTDLETPLVKVADDRVGSYNEIVLLRTSLRDKGKISSDLWKKNVVEEKDIPENITKIGSTMGNGSLEMIGYKINKKRFNQGDELKITLYHRVLKKIDENYKIFFHFEVYQGAIPHTFRIDEYPMKGYYPTNKWKEGEIIKQTFVEKIPRRHPGGGIKIYNGFFKGKKRMSVDENRYNDGENRFILGTFRINYN